MYWRCRRSDPLFGELDPQQLERHAELVHIQHAVARLVEPRLAKQVLHAHVLLVHVVVYLRQHLMKGAKINARGHERMNKFEEKKMTREVNEYYLTWE